ERDHVLQSGLSSYKLYKKNYFALQDSLNKIKSADSIFSMINNYYNEEIEALLAGGVYEGTTKLATDIYFNYASLLLNRGILSTYDLYIQQPTTNSSLVPMLSATKYYKTESENAFRMSGAYRNFLFDYVCFYRPLDRWDVLGSVAESNNKVTPFAPSWDDYYAGLKSFRIYELRDWFITKSIINDFGHYSFEDASAVYKDFMTKVKTPYYADTLKTFYAGIQRLKPGNPAPGFTLKDENGKLVSLSDFRGKVVFIDFWGIHCGPCLYEIKYNVPALQEKYKGKNIIFLNICVDADEKEWKENLGKLNLQGINLITEGWIIKNPVCITYGVNGIPHYYLIDKEGKIADNNAPRPSQGEILYSAMDKLLNK
ncbi:MAG TPA: TlpA disulfide reductase family protein, partial [Chitinophagaceae bacterium]|nr:TlpA disulfide reductase family protein [Chitinophagaceae bacterium]